MKCEICLCEFNKSTESLLAVISPWLRILGEIKQRTSQLFFCDNCQGAFFSLRYSNAQMKLIYSDYRGDNYMKIRNHWERWYTFDYNEAHQEQAFIDERKQVIQKFLVQHEIINVNSVVDVGGDLGQFIPDFQQNTRKFVLDYSNRKLMNGISRIENLKDQANPDLIIYAHVLEHVSEPLKELAALLNFTKNVYVEVPYGIPESSLFRRSRILHLLAQFVSFFPKVVFFSQTICRKISHCVYSSTKRTYKFLFTGDFSENCK